jgi:hypothetical protein
MKIHSDTLTEPALHHAAVRAGSGVEVTYAKKGSRSKDHAFDLSLTGTSSRRPNSGRYGAGDDYAATWDEWGMFLNHLYELDPEMECPYYKDRDDFNFQTGSRFLTLTPEQQCKNHKWEYQGTAATGAYYFYECRKCEAIRRSNA